MKKFLSILMAALLTIGICTCASAETVRFWSHVNESWNDSYQTLVSEFEAANPDIDVEYETFPYSDFEAKIQTSLMAGDAGADVYEIWGGWALDLIENGALMEVPSEYMSDLLEDTYEPVIGALQRDGKYYGVPIEFNVEYGAMLVDKHLFEEAGLEYPTTWQEVLDIAQQVAVQGDVTMEMRGLEYASCDNLTACWLSMILQKGGQYIMEDGSLDFTTPEAVEAMEELVSYITELHVTNLDSTIEAEAVTGHGYMGLGEVYMVVRGPWVIADLATTYGLTYGEDFDYISMPPFYEGAEQLWTAETGWSMCVSKNSGVADAAWKFVEFILEPENLLRHNIACAQIPPRKSVANDPAYLEAIPFAEPIVGILDKAQYIGAFNTDIFKVTYLRPMFVSLCSNDGTYESVEAACQKFTEDLAANMKIYS